MIGRWLVKMTIFLVNRKAQHAFPVTKSLAKTIVAQLTMDDLVKKDEDRKFPKEYVWIFVTSFGIKYYIKFINKLQTVLFISFHEAQY